MTDSLVYDKEAFTLIEIMVVIAIFAIVFSASYALMDSAKISWHTGDTSIELQEDLRQVTDDMAIEIAESAPSVITIGAGGNYITFQTPVDEDAAGTWEDTTGDGLGDFYLKNTLDSANNIVWGAYLRQEDRTVPSNTLAFGPRAGRQVVFILVADELHRRILASNGTVLEDFIMADDITNANFNLDANNVVTITIGAQKLTFESHPVTYSVTTQAAPRNS